MILWINLVTDGGPAIALTVDTPDIDVMKRKPRNPQAGILEGIIKFMLVTFVLMSIGTITTFYLGAFVVVGSSVAKGRTMAFLQASLFELLFVLNCRSEEKNVFSMGIRGLLSNKYLIISIIISGLVTAILPYLEVTRIAFGLSQLTIYEWLIVLGFASLGLFIPPGKLIKNSESNTKFV